MGEKIAIYLILLGGFVVAFVCLLCATLGRKIPIFRSLCLVGAFCGLLYEAGCLKMAGEIGTATSGDSKGEQMLNLIVGVAFCIAVVWSLVLIISTKKKSQERQPNAAGNHKNGLQP